MGAERAAGFTLLEVLLVVSLVGVLAGVAVLRVGGVPGREVATEAERLGALLRVARQEALLRGEVVGVTFTTGGYRFLRPHEEEALRVAWRPFADEHPLEPRTLGEHTTLRLRVEGAPAALDPPGPGEGVTEGAPQVLLEPTGRVTPFQVLLERGNARVRLEAAPVGRFDVRAGEGAAADEHGRPLRW